MKRGREWVLENGLTCTGIPCKLGPGSTQKEKEDRQLIMAMRKSELRLGRKRGQGKAQLAKQSEAANRLKGLSAITPIPQKLGPNATQEER